MDSGGSEGDPADQAAAPDNIEHLVGLYLAGFTETEFYVLHHTAIPGTADPVPRSMRVLGSIRSAEVLDAPDAAVHSGRLQRVARADRRPGQAELVENGLFTVHACRSLPGRSSRLDHAEDWVNPEQVILK